MAGRVMTTLLTVLSTRLWRNPRGRLGGFSAAHAQWLHAQLSSHWSGDAYCLTDVAVPGVMTLPLQTPWRGWWAKLEVCRPDIAGDVLYLDLDTVVLGGLDELAAVGRTTVLRDFYQGGDQMGSGLMYLAEADRRRIWAEFSADPDAHMRRCVTRECWGDQGFLQGVIGATAARWQDVLPGRVISFKADHDRAPARPSASVVCFHGNPRPWQVGHRWVPRVAA